MTRMNCSRGMAAVCCLAPLALCLFFVSTRYQYRTATWRMDKIHTGSSLLVARYSDYLPHPRNDLDVSSSNSKVKEGNFPDHPDDLSARKIYNLMNKSTSASESVVIPSLTDGKGTAKRLPDCIIVGVPKGGTFALIHFLGRHPDIAIPREEVNFFHVNESYSRGYGWYLKHLPYSQPGQITLEKSPRYFYYEYVPARIFKMNRHVKLMVLLRDPIERLTSCYVHRVTKYEKEHKPYNKSLEDVVINRETNEVDSGETCVATTLYANHLQRWLKHFPREQIHVIDGDMLIIDPYSEIHKVEEYLDLPAWFTSDMFHFNDAKGFYCFVKPGSAHQYCMPESKGREHPQISVELRQKLVDFFRPYNTLLSEILGRDFSWYKQYNR